MIYSKELENMSCVAKQEESKIKNQILCNK